MGITGLATFLSRLPGGRCKVNILDEIRKSGSKEPLVVIDLITIVCSLSGPVGEHIYGCRNQFAFATAAKFCNNLIAAGAKLTFFLNGKVQESKYDYWVQKQEKAYADSLKKMDDIPVKRNGHIHGNVTKHAFITALINVARKIGKLILTYDEECDRQAVAYARKHNALAVITGDSDYLIYQGRWRVWSSSDLNLKTMRTYEWNKEVLIKALGLKWSQMPFFAVIAGNDYFKHRPSGMRTFYEVAHIVRELRLELRCTKITIKLFEKIFGRKSKKLKRNFEKGIRIYDLKYTVPKATVPPEMRRFPNYTICILCNIPGSVRLPCLDLRDAEYSQLALQIYRRQVGMLFYHRRIASEDTLTSQVLIKPDHHSPYQLITVTPIYPPNDVIVPLPKELYSSKLSRTCKVRLLCWLVSDTLTIGEILHIPWEFLLDVVTLYFLVENNVLDVETADIILITIQDYWNNTIPQAMPLEQPTKCNVQTSFLYVHFYSMIYFCAEIVGLCEEFDTFFHCKFDGVYFNRIADHLRCNNSLLEVARSHIGSYRRYSKFSNQSDCT
ncbi:uncharacterized protein LOC129765250 [Toxorhynchites rutilus septentrionalis]|uniref:uncharacterized protein LOC129765250 n=1 Tax=Toxorhynchites rutilus septentrionalis TaxID=329112 RepID=UPI00247B2768|nr:uncharacterized protein LOC129765250 [Toxorhynchites rutilus septentrionalis]